MMNITKADVGRKVILRDGRCGTIEYVDQTDELYTVGASVDNPRWGNKMYYTFTKEGHYYEDEPDHRYSIARFAEPDSSDIKKYIEERLNDEKEDSDFKVAVQRVATDLGFSVTTSVKYTYKVS